MTGSQNPIASVCIVTLGRPEGLRRLLQTLLAQREAPAFEVVVIDNDASMSAKAVADAFSGTLNLLYAVEPERGLAAARNTAVRTARGEFVAFVDDDETVPEKWLCTLHQALAGNLASAAVGPVESEFETGVAETIRRCRFFARSTFAEGAAVPWYCAYTANAYLRVSALPDRAAPFRAHFGKTGGEDIDLFKRIAEAGGLIVAAGPASCVTEYRERARANFWWAMRRSVRNGGNIADILWDGMTLDQRRQEARTAFRSVVHNGICAVKVRSRDELRFVEHCIEAAEHAGRALSVLGYRYAEYGSRR